MNDFDYKYHKRSPKRWNFDELNNEKEYLDNIAIDILSTCRSEFTDPENFQFKPVITPTISSPHRLSTASYSSISSKSVSSQSSNSSTPPNRNKSQTSNNFESNSHQSFASFLSDSDHETFSSFEKKPKPKKQPKPYRIKRDQEIDEFVDNITDYTKWRT
ncbi:hypothetical protein TVAG_485910 [Trichomonas vaginalis G3]|uniref:Uncharacterized protein n=1 Tax=Trichomonas vaginalis (strain ATCC PRA-98 / G3) TaxID=412133 RepID=A2EED8_TRIV3|nr:hypothetical protein TVAGG3_0691520 [Trichomonas vaginalis G3]EAY08944.1 hypothetical protein TVAG_485910 [Trichomonas vaginalis G3]KAI5508607.1 hypothetical protein TVAGG3_0691520 [Trichomonas vaginalis G3]|eukprot:XP_001321167.1 hypothetical protein [Trichomonas vaginalis G3]